MEAIARAQQSQAAVTFSGTTEGGTPAAVSVVPVPSGGYAFAIRRVVLRQIGTETNLRDWIGERAQAGRLPPNGFPRSGRFAG